MEPVASGIAHRPNKWLFIHVPHIREIIDIPDDLVEKREQVNRMGRGAGTIVVLVDRKEAKSKNNVTNNTTLWTPQILVLRWKQQGGAIYTYPKPGLKPLAVDP